MSLSTAAAWLRGAEHIVVFTGAGVSAESGIATFRDADGFWQRFPPERFATWNGLVATAVTRPRRLAEFLLAVIEPIATAQPNAGHRAIERLERHRRVTVVTQNIDGLHSLAGNTIVFEIHGTMYETVTARGRFRSLVSREEMQAIAARLRAVAAGVLPLPRTLAAVRPLLGVSWRGVYRPNLVLFGQAMAEPAWSKAHAAAEACDVMLVVGTSGLVYPAALLPSAAGAAGAKTIALDPTPAAADLWLEGTAATVLPRLVEAAFGDRVA